MKKKLTKTISLIVFAMFLQLFITNVHATSGDIALTCVYDHPDETVILNITNSGSLSKAKASTFNGDVFNWKKKDYRGFSGLDYYLENHQCPPYAVYNSDLFTYDEVILARDKDNAKKIKSDIYGGKVMELEEQIIGEDASEEAQKQFSSNENIKKLNLPKTCECKENYNGTNISVKFEVSKNYKTPGDVTINFGASSNEEEIANYGSPYSLGGPAGWFYSEKSNYYYIKQLLAEDSCPDYAIVARRGAGDSSYFLMVSDEANLSDLKKDAKAFWGGTTYSLPCAEKIKTSNSNSNKTSNKKSNSNYEDPDVNSNVVRTLHYDVSTYSCGSEYLTGIPSRIPKLGKFVMNFLQILIPIVLIIYGSIDLLKAVYGSKEDDIKKSQQTFVKRLLSSIIIFFVFAIVKLVVSVVSNNNSPIMECVDCILRDSDNCYEEE